MYCYLFNTLPPILPQFQTKYSPNITMYFLGILSFLLVLGVRGMFEKNSFYRIISNDFSRVHLTGQLYVQRNVHYFTFVTLSNIISLLLDIECTKYVTSNLISPPLPFPTLPSPPLPYPLTTHTRSLSLTHTNAHTHLHSFLPSLFLTHTDRPHDRILRSQHLRVLFLPSPPITLAEITS